jgi:fatty-acyl-CoA synthase
MPAPKARTLASVLDERTAEAPRRAAIIYDGYTISYEELKEQSIVAARALLAHGVCMGDYVGVLLGNRPEWVVMALAADRVGAVCVPLNTWYKETEVAWTLEHCGISLLVIATSFLKTSYDAILARLVPELSARSARPLQSARFPRLRHVVWFGADGSDPRGWERFMASGLEPLALDAALLTKDRTAFILYTSGSSAMPKAVQLNHGHMIENGWHLGARRGITADDRVWIGTPLFYGLGAVNALPATLTHGASLVLQDYFEAKRALDVISKSEATVYYATGNMSRAMLDHPDYEPRSIGSLQKGNAGLGAEYKRMTLVEMGIRGAVPAYGLTETYGNVTVGKVNDPDEVKIRADGRPVPGMEMLIVDPTTGVPVVQGERGLVLIRGRVTPGYYNNAAANAALRSDGFFDSGDIGSLNADGHFVFHARLKEVIKSGGINISPTEVEQIISTHPDVRQAHVIGVRSAAKGEFIVAFVESLRRMSDADVKAYVKERAASYKTPHYVFFRSEEELPRLATGKIAKQKLIETARAELGVVD